MPVLDALAVNARPPGECRYDASSRSYDDNVVVFAELV